MTEETNKRLIKEYISKVECCDECFASVYCTVNRLRESRVPQDYCVKNIERYFNDKASQTGAERREFQQWVEALEQEPILDKVKLPKDEVTYGYISKQFPTTNVFFDSYETALNSAIHDQPKHGPFYMIKVTRHFEFCGVVEPQESEVGEC